MKEKIFFFTFQIFLSGIVEVGSPAEAAGLRPKDLIFEVNGVNVVRENHKSIVERIKASGDSTTFLVADPQCKVDCFEEFDDIVIRKKCLFFIIDVP